ncbi:MAG: carbonic anhydrase [Alphaproteobacteria bacterium]
MGESGAGRGGAKQFIDGLVGGYRKFRSRTFKSYQALFEKLARKGQAPKALVISCCDARVDPALITDADPGDLFIVRNVANLVPPYEPDGHYHGTSAALEFAVSALDVKHIIVLGHSGCGGVEALARSHSEEATSGEFIAQWMSIANRACEAVELQAWEMPGFNQARAVEHEVVKVSLENLLTFPWIKDRVARGVLSLHGWYFDIESGELSDYDRRTGGFRPL